MAEVVTKAARGLPTQFKLGKNKVYLPNHVITFVRKEHLPPNEACFNVPLTFNKFDLRDYLWNLYGVEVKKVRSYVKEQPLAQRIGYVNSWYRPQAQKVMTVELAQPFQWPSVPENLAPWHKEMWDQREEKLSDMRREQDFQRRGKIGLPSQEPESQQRKDLRELAQKMLKGEVKWENEVKLDPKWDNIVAQAKAKQDVAQGVVEAHATTKETEEKTKSS